MSSPLPLNPLQLSLYLRVSFVPFRTSTKSSQEQDVSALTSSNSNSNSNNGFIMVDYTQYLKDAHVSFAGNDPSKFSTRIKVHHLAARC